MDTQEIVKHRKLFMGGKYIKEASIKFSEHLYKDFKNKNEIVQKIVDPLCLSHVQTGVSMELLLPHPHVHTAEIPCA